MKTLIVNTTADTVDDADGKLSLREAVARAATMGEAVEIRFDAAVFYPDGATAAEAIKLTKTLTIGKGADIVIDGSTTFAGAYQNVKLSGEDLHENFLTVQTGAKVVLRDMRLSGGDAVVVGTKGADGPDGANGDNGTSGDNGPGNHDNAAGTPGIDGTDVPDDAADGLMAVGGIINRGTLTLDRVDVRDFGAIGGDGGIGGAGGRGGQGGTGSDETETQAGMDGADGGDSGNSGKGGNGGGAVAGIFNIGTLTIRDTAFGGLLATGGDGGHGGNGVQGGAGGNYGHETAWLPFPAAVAGDGGDGGDGGNGGAGGLAASALWNTGSVVFDSIQAKPGASDLEAGLGGIGGSLGAAGYGGRQANYTFQTGPNFGKDGVDGAAGVNGDAGEANDFIGATPTLGNNFFIDTARTVYSDSDDVNGRVVWLSLRQLGEESGTHSVKWKLSAGDGFDGSDIAGGYDPNGAAIKAGTLPKGGTVDMSGVGGKGFYLWLADDGKSEGIETFSITLSNPIGGALGYSRRLDFAIVDGSVAHTSIGDGRANALAGGTAADTLAGLGGKDRLDGKAGNDTLIGGAGKDELYGGAGKDTFIFYAGDTAKTKGGADTIHGFSGPGGDRVDLSHVDADVTRNGEQDFDFIGTAGFSKTAGELRYDKTGGDTYIYGDTNGDAKADFIIHLDAGMTVKEGYFVL